VIYKCTDVYTQGDEYGVLWSAPAIGIDWPVDIPILSKKIRKTKNWKIFRKTGCRRLGDSPKHRQMIMGKY